MIGYLNKPYLEASKAEQRKPNATVGKEAAVTYVSQDKGESGHFCGLENVPVLSVFRHDYRVVLFVS